MNRMQRLFFSEPIGSIGLIISCLLFFSEFFFAYKNYSFSSAKVEQEQLAPVLHVRLLNYSVNEMVNSNPELGRSARADFDISITNPSTAVRQISTCEIRFISPAIDGYTIKTTSCPKFNQLSTPTGGLDLGPGQTTRYTETFEGDVSLASLKIGGMEEARAKAIMVSKSCKIEIQPNGFDQDCPFALGLVREDGSVQNDQIKLFAVYLKTGRNETFPIAVYLNRNSEWPWDGRNSESNEIEEFQNLQ